MAQQTFKELEYLGWRQKADAYDDWFAKITLQAIEPLLDVVGGDLQGSKFLDVCTGTGNLTAAAAKRGAIVEGLDFADEMIAKAKSNYPTWGQRRYHSSVRAAGRRRPGTWVLGFTSSSPF